MLKIAFDKTYKYTLPEKHRFPMDKYELIPEQLIYEGTIAPSNLYKPKIADLQYVYATHQAEYVDRMLNGQISRKEEREIGFPYSKELIEREILILSGTIQSTQYAQEFGVAMNVAGGTHHASSMKGEGFCIFNDQAVAAHYLLKNGLAQRILILDLDVHQGNGTAEIFQNDPRVFTFSMHGAKNYPARKEQSDLDIPLEDKIGDHDYLKILKDTLPKVLSQVKPDFIFYQSGVDVLETDKLGRLGMTRAGCKARDEYVLSKIHQKAIPLSISMGGGYSERLSDIVEAHANTYRLAQEIYF